MKCPMGEGHTVPAVRLLHVELTPTPRAPFHRVIEGDEQVAERVHPSLTGLTQRGGFRSYGCERREGERTVFFSA